MTIATWLPALELNRVVYGRVTALIQLSMAKLVIKSRFTRCKATGTAHNDPYGKANEGSNCQCFWSIFFQASGW